MVVGSIKSGRVRPKSGHDILNLCGIPENIGHEFLISNSKGGWNWHYSPFKRQRDNGFSNSAASGTNVDSGAFTGQTTFTLSCQAQDGSNPPTSATVILVPAYIEQ
jgi:hypothetical protein